MKFSDFLLHKIEMCYFSDSEQDLDIQVYMHMIFFTLIICTTYVKTSHLYW